MKLVNIIINIIISIFYVLLFNYYLNNKYEKKEINHIFKYVIQFTIFYFITVIFNHMNSKYLFYCASLIVLYLSSLIFYRISHKNIIVDLSLITICFLITLIFILFIYEGIFELIYNPQASTINHILSNFLLNIVIIYISYIIVSLYLRQSIFNFQINFKLFKLISFFISILYVVFILINIQEIFLFPRITKITIFTFIIYNTSLLLFNKYQIHHDKIENLLILEKQRSEQEKKYIYEKMRADQEIQTFRHDLKNSYTILQAYITNNEYEKALDFINERTSKLMDAISINHLGMSSIDCIIEEKVKTMKEKNIEYKENITYSDIGCIIDHDIAMILALALDNAIEAAEKVQGYKRIMLSTHKNLDFIIFEIKNSVVPGTQLNFDKSSKIYDIKNHGFGVKEIKRFIHFYNGEYTYNLKDNEVILTFMLDRNKKCN